MTDLEWLQAITEETTLHLLTKTEVKLLKKDSEGNKNTLPKIFKFSTQKVLVNKSYTKAVNKSYTKAVNKQREKEGKPGDFVAEAVKLDGVAKGCTFEYNGQHYVKAILLNKLGQDCYQTEHGDAIEMESFQQFLSTTKAKSRQQVDEEVKVRKYKVDSIVTFEIVN